MNAVSLFVLALMMYGAVATAYNSEPSASFAGADGDIDVHQSSNEEFDDQTIACRVCDIAVDKYIRSVDRLRTNCIRDAEKKGAASVDQCFYTQKVTGKGAELLDKVCERDILDWFPAIEEQPEEDFGDDGQSASKSIAPSEDNDGNEQQMETAQGEPWPEEMPPVPDDHLEVVKSMCNRGLFSNSRELILDYIGRAIEDARGTQSGGRIYPAIKSAQETLCEAICGKAERPDQEPPRIKGWSMTMKPLR